MDVLSPSVSLPAHLDRWTDTRLDLRRVNGIAALGKKALMVSLGGPGRKRLYSLIPEEGVLRPAGGFKSVSEIWPCTDQDALVHGDGAIWRVGLDGRQGKLLSLPEGTEAFDLAWGTHGLAVAALIDRQEPGDPDAAWFYPTPRKSIDLCRYTSTEGWLDLARVPEGCRGIRLSQNGQRMVWKEPLNTVPEEAQRGEFFGFDVETGKVRQLTVDAGRVGRAVMASDGSAYLYSANYETERPITTHTDLWYASWEGEELVNLTDGGRCIENFGWGAGERSVWISVIEGLELKTEVLGLDGTPEGNFGELKASSGLAWLPDGQAVFEAESADDFPAIWTGTRRVPLPQAESYDDLLVSPVGWEAQDGTPIEGVLYESEDLSPDAPLLVSAHGGPAAPVGNLRSGTVGHRHLLRAGYRVLRPAFRGSLGFGDEFAQGNIGCQGHEDLGDILSGIESLRGAGLAFEGRVGIFGGSYGGYMTLRAMAVTDEFRAGVALYGFIDNRWMTLQTGDFTYENEYVAPLRWPITEEARASDVFPHLGSIRSPLLLIHGDKDPICPLSSSLATCRALGDQNVPVGLVVYPGEGHGFRKRVFRRDCARRTLAWFLTHLPPG